MWDPWESQHSPLIESCSDGSGCFWAPIFFVAQRIPPILFERAKISKRPKSALLFLRTWINLVDSFNSDFIFLKKKTYIHKHNHPFWTPPFSRSQQPPLFATPPSTQWNNVPFSETVQFADVEDAACGLEAMQVGSDWWFRSFLFYTTIFLFFFKGTLKSEQKKICRCFFFKKSGCSQLFFVVVF